MAQLARDRPQRVEAADDGSKIGKADMNAQDGTLHSVTESRLSLEWTFCGAQPCRGAFPITEV